MYLPGIGQEGSLLRDYQILVGGFKDNVRIRDALVIHSFSRGKYCFP